MPDDLEFLAEDFCIIQQTFGEIETLGKLGYNISIV